MSVRAVLECTSSGTRWTSARGSSARVEACAFGCSRWFLPQPPSPRASIGAEESNRVAKTMTVEQATEGSTVVLTPKGEIDMAHSPSLQKTIASVQAEKPPKLVLDLSAVPYMDSSGIATLVEALQTSMRNKSKLVLCNLSPRVRSAFEISRLIQMFSIAESRDAALKA
ncbi:MAG: STAS domain-containing protein [Phycisphaerales bacterium]|nr:STAS domain-containing protein [Phycisphaerales bacterium]